VPQDRGPLAQRDLLELLLPAVTLRGRHIHLADDLVENQIQQAVLVADVPVQGGGAGVQRVRHPPHAQPFEAFAVQDLDRGLGDRLDGDRIPARPAGPSRGPLPGRLWNFARHTNSVLPTNTLDTNA
jgi:hypothetical protein